MDTAGLVTFLRGLKTHNNRPWFDAHRDEYAALRKDFAEFVQHVITLIAKFDPAIKHVTAKEGMYRINRDIRFSKDKTLYKTNFGAGIEPGGRKGMIPGYHLHIAADGKVMVAGGLYMLTPQQLSAIRDSIVRHPGKLRSIVNTPAFKKTYDKLDDEDHLKKSPRGMPVNHPDMDLIKLKRFVAWTEWPISKFPTSKLPEEIAKTAKILYPLDLYLRQAVS